MYQLYKNPHALIFINRRRKKNQYVNPKPSQKQYAQQTKLTNSFFISEPGIFDKLGIQLGLTSLETILKESNC